MKLEHIAFNVPDAKAHAKWYSDHLGMTIVRSADSAPFITFISDGAGSLIEFYSNEAAATPDYKGMHPLILHVAFSSEDLEADIKRLEAAGASHTGVIETIEGMHTFHILRDPWGLALQLIKRVNPLV